MGCSFQCGVVWVGAILGMQKAKQGVCIRSQRSLVRSRVSTQEVIERFIRGVVIREIRQEKCSKKRQ